MKPKFFLLSDSESECHAIYDEKGNFIIGWQEGDDISRVFKNFLMLLDLILRGNLFQLMEVFQRRFNNSFFFSSLKA